MPSKIGFQVVSCSGEDGKYRVNELNYHGPTVRGWRSCMNCSFPQEIVLQLKVSAILHQIQILAHQYLIPQKIDICIYSNTENDTPSESTADSFEYLGYITFSDNKATGFRSRELKSIMIPLRKANFIKLRIHQNHSNVKNVFNQVGLMGVNVLGDEINIRTQENELNNNVWFQSNSSFFEETKTNSNYTSPYDDLAFEMYVDEETVKVIKLIEHKKLQAIFEENFEYANILKVVLENLRAAGELIGLYEQEKKQAIRFEDFDKAKFKKIQIENFRQKVYENLQIDGILNFSDSEEEVIRQPCLYQNQENLEHNKLFKHPVYNTTKVNLHNQAKLGFFGNSPCKSTAQKSASFNQMIYSKSQNSFINFGDRTAPLSENNLGLTTSISNPQVHQYSEVSQDRENNLNHSREFKPMLPSQLGYVKTSSSSSSLDSEEKLLETKTGDAPFSEKNLYKLDNSIIEFNKVNKKNKKSEFSCNTTNQLFWNESNMHRSPPDSLLCRGRTRFSQQSKMRSKSLAAVEGKTSFEAYEDRMLPALRSYHGNEVVRECQLAFDQLIKTSLNEKEKKQAALPISVFGIEMIEKFYSKSFTDKEEGLKQLQIELKKIINSSCEDNKKTPGFYNRAARAAIFLLHRTIRDKVYSVYSLAAETIRLFFTEFVPQRISSSEVGRSIEKLLPELLIKSGDVTPRIHNMAAHTLLSMAESEEVRNLHIIPSQLSKPLSTSVHPRLALSRLEMVEQLILSHGISKDKRSGLTCRTLAEFGSSGLHHPAEAVRKVSERILLHVYKVNPRIVRKQLPPDDDVTRRNLLYRQLYKEFDLIDAEKKLLEGEEENKNQSLAKNEIQYNSIPNVESKEFSLKNVQEITDKTPNFNSQLKNIKNFMSLNFQEKSKVNILNRQESTKPKLKTDEKSPSKFSASTSQKFKKYEFYSDYQIFQAQKNSSTVGREKKEKAESDMKLHKTTTKKKIEDRTQKFPPLTDSIDTTHAKMLLQKTRNKPEQIEGILIKQTAENSSLVNCKNNNNQKTPIKKEIKRNFFTSSGIPKPTFGSNRKYSTNLSRKMDKNKTSNHTTIIENKKNKIEIQNIRTPGQMKNKNYSQSIDNKNNLEKSSLSKQMIKSLQKDGNISVEAFKLYLEHQIQRANGKDFTLNYKNSQFSESMLASIRENEYQTNLVQADEKKMHVGLKTCIFCLTSKNWTTENSLNNHYLKECPMLTTCEYCTEVTEISGFTNHLLEECNQKDLFKKCSKCQQAVLEDLYNNHECIVTINKTYKTRCPFCHKDVGEDESRWRKHLMGNNICSNHPRQMT